MCPIYVHTYLSTYSTEYHKNVYTTMIAKLSFTVHLFKFLWLTENVKHFEAQMQMVRLHVFLIVNSSHYNSWNFTISNLHFHLKYQLKCEISGNSSISAKSSKRIFFLQKKKKWKLIDHSLSDFVESFFLQSKLDSQFVLGMKH